VNSFIQPLCLQYGLLGRHSFPPTGGYASCGVWHIEDTDVEEFDEEFSLNWTQPLTPRHATRGRRPHQRRDFASALQLEGCASKYADPVKIGAGDYASVYRIRKKAFGSSFVKSKRKYYAYAVKVPNPDDHEAEEAAEHEMTVMSAAKEHQCEHVLPLLEKDPCVNGHEVSNAFVTKLLPWDLC